MQITPGSARSLLSPQIQAIIERLSVRWVEPSVFYKATGAFFRYSAQGTYHVLSDAISVKPGNSLSGRDVDYVFLHELTHWTGHESRLAREAMTIAFASRQEMDLAISQEEATAEIGAYLLAPYFGLDPVKALSTMLDYVANYPEADLIQARKDAEAATMYILKALNEQAAKAA